MKQEWPRTVWVLAEEAVLIEQMKASERGMRRESMLDRDNFVGLETGGHRRVEHVLIREVERIREARLPVPRAVKADFYLALVPQREQPAAERVGNEQLPGIEVWLPPKRAKTERGAP